MTLKKINFKIRIHGSYGINVEITADTNKCIKQKDGRKLLNNKILKINCNSIKISS